MAWIFRFVYLLDIFVKKSCVWFNVDYSIEIRYQSDSTLSILDVYWHQIECSLIFNYQLCKSKWHETLKNNFGATKRFMCVFVCACKIHSQNLVVSILNFGRYLANKNTACCQSACIQTRSPSLPFQFMYQRIEWRGAFQSFLHVVGWWQFNSLFILAPKIYFARTLLSLWISSNYRAVQCSHFYFSTSNRFVAD